MSEEAHFFVRFFTSCAERAVKKSFPARKNMPQKSHKESLDFCLDRARSGRQAHRLFTLSDIENGPQVCFASLLSPRDNPILGKTLDHALRENIMVQQAYFTPKFAGEI